LATERAADQIEGEPPLAIGQAQEQRIASEATISRAAGAGTGTPSEVGLGDTTDRALAPVEAVVRPAWDLEVEDSVAEVAVDDGGRGVYRARGMVGAPI